MADEKSNEKSESTSWGSQASNVSHIHFASVLTQNAIGSSA